MQDGKCGEYMHVAGADAENFCGCSKKVLNVKNKIIPDKIR